MGGASTDVEDLAQRMQAGDRQALARLMTLAENGSSAFQEIFPRLQPDLGRARRVGVTGPPGAGKSTLVGRLIGAFREAGETVGVVAVDPTSPVSGGALLGDRIRMPSTDDPGVYVRSMASRGSAGGLARQSLEVADLLDAFGRDWILVETVGTGQGELEVVAETDMVVVVVHPGSGDAVQAMKAGVFEVANVVVVNQADRPEAAALKGELEWALRPREAGRAVPVLLTSATENRGVEALVDVLRRQHDALRAGGGLQQRRRERVKQRLVRLVEDCIAGRLIADAEWQALFETLARRVADGELDRYAAARELLTRLTRRLGSSR